ncbi:MAG: hypothetical protein HQK50_15515 [Oligoflexia bacterium]|nr:hypothetical protein [Oligoflexia bacterium]MBF0366983.1 hypothetical protein [Oligoflexia bacterium]
MKALPVLQEMSASEEQLDFHRQQISGVFTEDKVCELKEYLQHTNLISEKSTPVRTALSSSQWLFTIYGEKIYSLNACGLIGNHKKPRIRFYLDHTPASLSIFQEGSITLSCHKEIKDNDQIRILEITKEKSTMTLQDFLIGLATGREALVLIGGVSCRREVWNLKAGRVTFDNERQYSNTYKKGDRVYLIPLCSTSLVKVEYKFSAIKKIDPFLINFFTSFSYDPRTNFEILQYWRNCCDCK